VKSKKHIILFSVYLLGVGSGYWLRAIAKTYPFINITWVTNHDFGEAFTRVQLMKRIKQVDTPHGSTIEWPRNRDMIVERRYENGIEVGHRFIANPDDSITIGLDQ
jgi:hypothetical protein